MSGSDLPSEHDHISLTKEDGNERSISEGDLVTEGEFRSSVVKVPPSFVLKVSPHILPMGNHDSHAYEVEWKVTEW